MLDTLQRGAQVPRQIRLGQQQSQRAVQLVGIAEGGNPEIVFGDAPAIAQTGAAVITGTRVDAAQSMAHDSAPGAGDHADTAAGECCFGHVDSLGRTG